MSVKRISDSSIINSPPVNKQKTLAHFHHTSSLADRVTVPPPKEEFPGNAEFDIFTTHITQNEKSSWVIALDKIRESRLYKVSEAIKEARYEDPYLKIENFDNFPNRSKIEDAAVQSLRKGYITLEQLCSFLFLRSFMVGTLTAKDIKHVSLFLEDGSVNPKADQLIRSTLPRQTGNPLADQDGQWITDEQLKRFYKKMKKVPFSERQFVTLPDTHHPEDCLNATSFPQYGEEDNISTSRGIYTEVNRVGFCVFSKLPKKNRLMIPSY